jgi:hypothetical protein
VSYKENPAFVNPVFRYLMGTTEPGSQQEAEAMTFIAAMLLKIADRLPIESNERELCAHLAEAFRKGEVEWDIKARRKHGLPIRILLETAHDHTHNTGRKFESRMRDIGKDYDRSWQDVARVVPHWIKRERKSKP